MGFEGGAAAFDHYRIICYSQRPDQAGRVQRLNSSQPGLVKREADRGAAAAASAKLSRNAFSRSPVRSREDRRQNHTVNDDFADIILGAALVSHGQLVPWPSDVIRKTG